MNGINSVIGKAIECGRIKLRVIIGTAILLLFLAPTLKAEAATPLSPDATGKINITTSGDYSITGTVSGGISVASSIQASITLNSVKVDMSSSTSAQSALSIGNSSKVKLIINGYNTLKSSSVDSNVCAGVALSAAAQLTIESSTNGKLTAVGGSLYSAGIGSISQFSAIVTINSGTVEAIGGDRAAGMGSCYNKIIPRITINGGTVNAVGGNSAAGIGAGYMGVGNGATVTINGGLVKAVGGNNAAGIGSGDLSYSVNTTITGGTVIANSIGNTGAGGISAFDGNAIVYTNNIIGNIVNYTKGVVYNHTTVSTDGNYTLTGGIGTVYGNPNVSDFFKPTGSVLGTNLSEVNIPGSGVTATIPDIAYTGAPVIPSATVTVNKTALKKTLIQDFDYNLIGITDPISAGSKTAIITAVDGTGNVSSSTAIPFNIIKPAPSLALLTYSVTDADFTGSPLGIGDVTAKDGVAGLGTITVKYRKSGTAGAYSDTTPTYVGSYDVVADIAEGESYASAILNLGTFTINCTDGIGELYGHSLTLMGNIGVNFYMELADSVVADAGAYMQFMLPNGTVTNVPVSQAKTSDDTSGRLYCFSCEVCAPEMTDFITAKLILGNGTAGTVYTYSVKDYAAKVLADPDSYSNLVPLVKAMMNYGGYSQIYFNHNTGNLANDSIFTEGTDPVQGDIIISDTYAFTAPTTDIGLKYGGASLILNSETTLRIYFENTSDVNPSNYTYSISGGTSLVPTVKGNLVYVDISNIASAELDSIYTVSVVNQTDTTQSLVVSYSPLCYVKAVLDRTDVDIKLKNVVKALYLYHQAAKNYFIS